jgi:parallel beta-helix repeat protein
MPRNPRLGLSLVAAAIAAALFSAAPASAAASCDRVAAAGPGSAQRLVDDLNPGQTGCLRGGVHTGNVRIGTPNITLTRFGSEKATVRGRLYIAEGSNGVSVEGLYLDGTNQAGLPSPTVNADGVTFSRNDVTNNHTGICFALGHQDWGRANGARIEFNRIHDCGRLPATNHDHGIYITAATGVQIRGNWIYDNADRGIQLYPDAQNTTITGNVIDRNGQGIIFSGEGGLASSGNLVEGNVITNSRLRNNVESWYPSGNPVGRNNVVRNNCVKGGAYDDGDGGIGDQRGFRVLSTVEARASFSDRSADDLRLREGSPCRGLLAFRAVIPGPDGTAAAPVTRGLKRGKKRRPVVLAAATSQLRRGARLLMLGYLRSGEGRPGQRVHVFARAKGKRRRLGSARVDAQGRFALRSRVRVGRKVRAVRVTAVVKGVGHSRSIRVRLRGR